MSQFVKSILNYYAAFTETRFSNRSTLNYKWLEDPNLTLDLSFFTDFFSHWINKLENNDTTPLAIASGEFRKEVPSHRFHGRLTALLESEFHKNHFLAILDEEQDGRDLKTEEEKREIFLEAARTYNLSLRKAIEQIVYSLQREEVCFNAMFAGTSVRISQVERSFPASTIFPGSSSFLADFS